MATKKSILARAEKNTTAKIRNTHAAHFCHANIKGLHRYWLRSLKLHPHCFVCYITSTKNSQGLPMAIRKDCRLPDISSGTCWSCRLPPPLPLLPAPLAAPAAAVDPLCSEPLERDRREPDSLAAPATTMPVLAQSKKRF
jgi:hypothetical protein